MITHRLAKCTFVYDESFSSLYRKRNIESIHCETTMSELDSLATQLPQELRIKLMQHFGIAKEYENNSQTLCVTYYCLMYIANEALKLQKDKLFVGRMLDHLEAMKRIHSTDERIMSMVAGRAAIEELISTLVNETLASDHDDDKTTDQWRALMKKHYTVGGLVDVLSVFGPVNDDFVTLGKTSKNLAVSIFRDLKSGQHPNLNNRRPVQPPSVTNPTPSEPSKNVPFNVISEAQKLFRFANSALEHDDVRTAVHNCEQILQLLQPYR